MIPKVAIIGAGPAGLLAAHAVQQVGAEVTIYASSLRRRFPGAQVLQATIPGLTPLFADAFIHVAKWGEEEHYRAKVYGQDSEQRTSWFDYGGPVPCWDMSNAYNHVLGRFRDDIIDRHISPEDIVGLNWKYDAIINTAPAPMFCVRTLEHSFPFAGIRITEGAQPGVQHNQIVYNGTTRDGWYRSSRLFGHGSTEWPDGDGIIGTPIHKPLGTDCNCWTDLPAYYRAGRFGRWQKGVLVHDGYEVGMEAVHALLAV